MKIETNESWKDAFYNALVIIGKILIIVGFLALVIYLRVVFDSWYYNQLIK